MQRRDFLRLGALGGATVITQSTGLLDWIPRAHAASINFSLTALSGTRTQIDGVSTYHFSFSDDGSVRNPGPILLCQEGDNITVNLTNRLLTKVAFAVGGIGKRIEVLAGASVSLAFTAPAAGTYLYYDDLNGGVNRIMGLHGPLIVMPKGTKTQSFSNGPTFRRQYVWVFAEFDSNWSNLVRTNGDNYVAGGALKSSGFTPRYFTINGTSYPNTHDPDSTISGAYGEAALIRIINAGMAVHSPHFHGNHVDIISVNRANQAKPKTKDIVPLFALDCRDVIFPMKVPPDAYPPVTTAAQHFPMHCHAEMSQTAGGGHYPKGAHAVMDVGVKPSTESDLQQKILTLP